MLTELERCIGGKGLATETALHEVPFFDLAAVICDYRFLG